MRAFHSAIGASTSWITAWPEPKASSAANAVIPSMNRVAARRSFTAQRARRRQPRLTSSRPSARAPRATPWTGNAGIEEPQLPPQDAAVYIRHRYLEERRQALEAWAAYVLDLVNPAEKVKATG